MCPQTLQELLTRYDKLSAGQYTREPLENRSSPFYSAIIGVIERDDFKMADLGVALQQRGKMIGFEEVDVIHTEKCESNDGHQMLEATFSKTGYEDLTLKLQLIIQSESLEDKKICVIVNNSDPTYFVNLKESAKYMSRLLGVTVYSGIA